MELRRLWHLIWHRKLLVAVLVIVALVAGYEVTPRIARYRATAVLYVNVGEYNPQGVFNNDVQTGQQQAAATFATMLPSLTVAQAAVATTGVPRSAEQVLQELRSEPVAGTSLIYVSVTDRDPVVAMELANAASEQFVNEMLKIDPVISVANGTSSSLRSPLSVYEPASVPYVPLSNGLSRNLVLSGLFGLLVSIGLILLLDYLDLSVRSPADLERRISLPVLGVVPLYSKLADQAPLLPARRSGAEELASEIHG